MQIGDKVRVSELFSMYYSYEGVITAFVAHNGVLIDCGEERGELFFFNNEFEIVNES